MTPCARWMWTTVGVTVAVGCAGTGPPEAPSRPKASATVTLSVEYGSEKKAWMEAAVSAFEATSPHTAGGKSIDVNAHASGSGEGMTAILSGKAQPAVYSPASGAYLTLLNEGWLAQGGHTAGLVSDAQPVVLSPIVIAMWEPMARALGWPEQKIGWQDILAIATEADGWAAHGRPEWGRFKLAHTHPGLSNSGLLAVLAETYAGAEKRRGLTGADLARPEVATFVSRVEGTLVHYGKSTSFLQDKMLTRGPSYVSAAVLYENLVVEMRSAPTPPPMPVVAIYPKEGTFWSDHPFATLSAPWVSTEQGEAAKVFEAFLHSPEQQRAAMALGFRPADPSIAIAAPLDAAHGVDPLEPQTLLEVPDGQTLAQMLPFWEGAKKSADVTLVFDKSGSMRGSALTEAKAGANAFLDGLGDRDELSILFFDSQVPPAEAPSPLGGGGRERMKARIADTFADGGTALYQAVDVAFDAALTRAAADPGRIHAVVVMTDGKNESSRFTLDALLAHLQEKKEAPVKVFTIAYGEGADPAILTKIAEAGQGSTAQGSEENIDAIFADMAAFF